MISCKSFRKVDLRPEVIEIADSIANENILTSDAVGYSGMRPKQWDRFEKLKNIALTAELVQLTEYNNSVVRCYAFQALAGRKDVDIIPILINHLHDTASLETFRGCIKSSEMVGDYFIDVVTPQYIDLNLYKLNDKQRQLIDSILIFDKDISLSAKTSVLFKIKPEERYYERIKEIAINEKNNYAIIALSKYKRHEDTASIIRLLKDNDTDNQFIGLQCVKNFPDSCFFSYVSQIHKIEIKKPTSYNYAMLRMLYQAIVQYKNQTSRQLLDNTFNFSDSNAFEYHRRYIWLALKKYPDKIYEGYLNRIELSDWEKEELQYWLED